MSGLAGVCWLDPDRHATRADIARPLTSLAHRGPDGLFATAAGNCALGLAHYITTPEARLERQPHVSATGMVVTFDGRLDNADELRLALRLHQERTRADVEVVAAAWERWGVGALDRLLGDFALAVFDPTAGKLWLARDAFGLRPLMYRTFKGGFWWASEVQALARLGDARVNHGMVAEYLADSITNEVETLVDGVCRVPRASVLTLRRSGQHEVRRYWTPSIRETPAHSGDAEIVDEFRTLFRTAVGARMRSDRPVAVALSGGLDSSLVVAEAAALERAGLGAAVHTFTLSLPNHAADESVYAQAVARHLRAPSTVRPFGSATLPAIVDDAERALDMPLAPNCVAAASINEAILAQGLRVCLNGVGGNEWFSGCHFTFADQVRRLEFVEIVRRMRTLRREDQSFRPMAAGRLAIWLQLPESARRLSRRLLGLPRVPSWVQPAFAQHTALVDRLRNTTPLPDLPTIQQQLMFAWAVNAANMFVSESTERISAAVPSEERMPFLDRRIVEWALGLPEHQRRRGESTKVVLRHAAASVLPAHIVARERGPDFSFQTALGLQQIGGRALIDAVAEERHEWVSVDVVRRMWDQVAASQCHPRERGVHLSWPLWLLVGTHLAARAIERCRPIVRSGDLCASIADIKVSRAREDAPQETVA